MKYFIYITYINMVTATIIVTTYPVATNQCQENIEFELFFFLISLNKGTNLLKTAPHVSKIIIYHMLSFSKDKYQSKTF